MILDNSLSFVSTSQAITTTAPSTNIIDLTGIGSGTAPNLAFGTASTFAEDLGIGDGEAMPKVVVVIGTTFATSSSATLTIQVQGAPDNGSNLPGSYTTYAEIPTLSVSSPANLTGGTGTTEGSVHSLDLPKVPAGVAFPRFLRLNFQVNVGSFSAGAISFAGIALQRNDSYAMSQYPRNYTVAA